VLELLDEHPRRGQDISMRSIVHGFTFLFLLAVLIRAELPPSAYEAMQTAAPEFLAIEILRVDYEPGETMEQQNITVLARVTKVHRSASSLQEGAIISVVYPLAERAPGFVGPGRVPVPSEGESTVAYLKPGDKPDQFTPAAGAMTFHHF
jgi:hypothetical protein